MAGGGCEPDTPRRLNRGQARSHSALDHKGRIEYKTLWELACQR